MRRATIMSPAVDAAGSAAGADGEEADALAEKPGILVLGLGNILLSDEGVGVRCVEALAAHGRLPRGVEVLDGGTSGMDLLDQIAARVHLIVVDAVKTGRPPGTVIRLTGNEVPALFRTRVSPHQLGLSDILAALWLMDAAPKSVTVIGVEPVCLDLSLELSAPVEARLPELIALVHAEIAALMPE